MSDPQVVTGDRPILIVSFLDAEWQRLKYLCQEVTKLLEAVDTPDTVREGVVLKDCREVADRMSRYLDPVARLYYKYWWSYSQLLQSAGEPFPKVWITKDSRRDWLRSHLNNSNKARSAGLSVADVGSGSHASPSGGIEPQTPHQGSLADVLEAPGEAGASAPAEEVAETGTGSGKRRRRSVSEDDENSGFSTKRYRQGKNNAFFVNGGSFVFNHCTISGKRE